MDLNFVDLLLRIRTDDAQSFARILNGCGGKLSYLFREHVCLYQEQRCEGCSRCSSCSWLQLFGQVLTPDPIALKRHQKPPLPFMFTLQNQESAHDISLCRLVVVGSAVPHLPLFLEVLSGMLSENDSLLEGVASCDYRGDCSDIHFQAGTEELHGLNVLSAREILENSTWNCTHISVFLQSPLRLMSQDGIQSRFDFSLFARSIVRRISSLLYYYGEQDLNIDFSALFSELSSVVCSDDNFRFSGSRNGKMSGVTGNGTFCGDLSGILPFLVLGSFFHVGKNASFGMGSYRITSV